MSTSKTSTISDLLADISPRISVALICGGQSPEHEVSLMSAQNILHALNRDKFSPHVIYIHRSGSWHYADYTYHNDLSSLMRYKLPELAFAPVNANTLIKQYFIFKNNDHKLYDLYTDIAFPVLHGQLGEDGALQGLLKMLNMPFVGNDVLSSAICMDKEITKKLLGQANINTAKYLIFYASDKMDFEQIKNQLNLPFFLKPANTGSSIGVYKIKNQSDFNQAVSNIFRFDKKIVAEEFIDGREIECAVLGNQQPQASVPGEIICHHEFYSYEAKYIDKHGAEVVVPANLSPAEIEQFQTLSLKAFKLLDCSGLARVDFLYDVKNKKIYLNEINTLPGFTNISMYPKCFMASGMSYSELIEKLILLGLEKQRTFET